MDQEIESNKEKDVIILTTNKDNAHTSTKDVHCLIEDTVALSGKDYCKTYFNDTNRNSSRDFNSDKFNDFHESIYNYYTSKVLFKKELPLINEENKFLFFLAKLKNGQEVRCNIFRTGNNFKAYSQDTNHFLFSAFQMKKKLRSNFIISTVNEEENITEHAILGRLNGSLTKKNFILYDNGESPKTCKDDKKLRKYMLETKLKTVNNFRQLNVYIPQKDNANKFINKSIDKEDKLSKKFQENETSIIKFTSKLPEYSIGKLYYNYF